MENKLSLSLRHSVCVLLWVYLSIHAFAMSLWAIWAMAGCKQKQT